MFILYRRLYECFSESLPVFSKSSLAKITAETFIYLLYIVCERLKIIKGVRTGASYYSGNSCWSGMPSAEFSTHISCIGPLGFNSYVQIYFHIVGQIGERGAQQTTGALFVLKISVLLLRILKYSCLILPNVFIVFRKWDRSSEGDFLFRFRSYRRECP
jgi:hypothetical protein